MSRCRKARGTRSHNDDVGLLGHQAILWPRIGPRRLNRGGDRQLNHALHIIAITRAQRDPATNEYLARKEAEGKTTKGALRCLKRHLARRFYHLLADPPADRQQAANGKPIIEPDLATIPEQPRQQRAVEQISTAPNPMVCIS